MARGYQRLRRRELSDISFGERRPQIRHQLKEGCVIIDQQNGRQLLALTYEVLRLSEESALVTLASGLRLRWTLQFTDRDRATGFYDDHGAGGDDRLQPPSRHHDHAQH